MQNPTELQLTKTAKLRLLKEVEELKQEKDKLLGELKILRCTIAEISQGKKTASLDAYLAEK